MVDRLSAFSYKDDYYLEKLTSKTFAVTSLLTGIVSLFIWTFVLIEFYHTGYFFSINSVFSPILMLLAHLLPMIALIYGIKSIVLRKEPDMYKSSATLVCSIFGISSVGLISAAIITINVFAIIAISMW